MPTDSTEVNQQSTDYQITGGQRSADGTNLFHGFEKFGLDAGEQANFLVPAGVANVLGRINGGDASVINGQLRLLGSDADLFLLNPAGMIFGESATLALPGDFLATTAQEIEFTGGTFPSLGTVDYANLLGAPVGLGFATNGEAVLINSGSLAVNDDAGLSLIGSQVINTGSLSGGTVTLAATREEGNTYVRIGSAGSVLAYEVLPQQIGEGITPLGLSSLLTQPSITSATGLTVNSDGSLQLAGASLEITPGTMVSTGDVTGSTIQLLGDRIGILAGTITAPNGGDIWLGGNQTGIGPLPNANTIYVAPTVTITADGPGAGGNIIVWSKESSRIHGRISARGEGGDGGFVETSSRGFLEVTQAPDVSSAQGNPGLWLIDPYDIEIRENGVSNENFTPSNPFTATGSPAVLDVSILREALGFGSVVVSTGDSGGENGDISLLDPLTYTTAPGTTLELSAAGDIAINASITPATGATSPLNIELQADRSGQGTGTVTVAENVLIQTSGGSLLVRGNGEQAPNGAGVSLFSGTTVETDGGTIDIFGRDGNGPGVSIEANTRLDTNGTGDILIRGTSDTGIGIDIANNVTTNSSLLSLDGQVGDSTQLAIQSTSPLVDTEVIINSVGDVEIGYVDVSGSIDITTNNFLRVTGTNGQGQSLFAPDSIRINHGGNGFTPFTVGDAGQNGTAGAIATSSTNVINPERSFFDSFFQGSIEISTADADPNECIEGCNDFGEDEFEDDFGEDDFGEDDILEEDDILGEDDFEFEDEEEDFEEDDDFEDEFEDEDFEDDSEFEDVDGGSFDILEDTEITAEDLAIREKFISQEYSQYLGNIRDRNLPLPEVQQQLNQITAQTGHTPGIVYVNFVPNTEKTSKQILELNQDNHLLELVLIIGQAPAQSLLIDTTKADIKRVVRRLQRGVTTPSLGDRYLRPAQQLHNWLISPLEKTLSNNNITHLAFVLPSGLRSLPLAALHNGNSFLVERYSLGIMPSVGLTNINYSDVRSGEVLAAGASKFPDQPDLPAVPLELRTIADTLWPGQFFLNESFTPEQLLANRQRGRYNILHLATHGEFRAGNPSNSYIQFWDQRITLNQLPTLSLNDPPIDLLVLSACRTALGSREAELGFAGLAVQAGVKTALASLWRVDDVGTAGLMTEFYSNLRYSTMRAEALRQAQLAMLQGNVVIDAGQLSWTDGTLTMPPVLVEETRTALKHPFYWAAFTLIGSPW
ncbi:MAG: CHAT domain-containing protein [Cyanobacteria bacterium P01_D01_bin.156]